MGTGYTDWEGVSVEPLPIGASPAALVTGNSNLSVAILWSVSVSIWGYIYVTSAFNFF